MKAQAHLMLAVINIIEAGGLQNSVIGADAAPKDSVMLTAETPWMATDLQRMKRLIEMIVTGAQQHTGMPVFEVSAEVYAAVIARMVHPSNWMSACQCVGRKHANSDLADGLEGERVDPKVVFALICAHEGELGDRRGFLERFSKKTNFKIAKFPDPEGTEEQTS